MGRNNQPRRAAKKREGSRCQRSQESGRSESFGGRLMDDPVSLLRSAGRSAAAAGDDQLEALVERLAHLSAWTVDDAAAQAFAGVLTAVFEGGWQPAEVVRAVRRSRTPQHADLATTAMAVDLWRLSGAVAPAGWAAQLAELEVERWWGHTDAWLQMWARRAQQTWPAALRVASETLGALMELPVIEAVLPPPSAWGTSPGRSTALVADDVMAKIRALLAKAESTSFEAEAEALTTKAQQLMARHAVDEAVARAEGRHCDTPTLRRIPVDDPYAAAKVDLLDVVGRANGVRTVSYRSLGLSALVGFPSDVDAVEVLFTSLLVQATRALVDRGRVTDARGRSRTRSYRQSFLLAYASRIRERLHAAAAVAHHEAETALGRSLLPVLAGRERDVEQALASHFPSLRFRRGPKATNIEGWQQGRIAGELATLGEKHNVLTGAG